MYGWPNQKSCSRYKPTTDVLCHAVVIAQNCRKIQQRLLTKVGNFSDFYNGNGKSHKKSIRGGHTVGPSCNRWKSKNVTRDLQACDTETSQKWLFWGKTTPLRENFQNSSIKVQQRTRIDVFFLNFMPICPVTNKCEFIVPVTKHASFSPSFCALWPRATKF